MWRQRPACVDSTERGSGVSAEIIVRLYAAPLGVIEGVERFPSELYGTVLATYTRFIADMSQLAIPGMVITFRPELPR
jgi:hypothetical protein